MRQRNKTPFCSLAAVFNHPSIILLCQQLKIKAARREISEDPEALRQELLEVVIELHVLIVKRAYEHMAEKEADEFIEEWDDLPTNQRVNALLNIYGQYK